MLRNLMLTLAYDGADFHGWQNQPGLRTVQSCVETALRRALRHQVVVIGCSRTDAGVHAAAYVANAYTTAKTADLPIARSIGSRLPKDMTLLNLETVPLTFHATRSALGKLYRYRVHAAPGRPCEQLTQRFTYHFWQALDVQAMRAAAEHLIGRHDFTSFASAGNVRESNVRTIRRIDVYRVGLEVRFDIEGDGFLYKQVRNMVGTLIEVGRAHRPPEWVAQVRDALDRAKAGPTAPARGLCLQWVRYNLRDLPEPTPEVLDKAREAGAPPAHLRALVERQHRSLNEKQRQALAPKPEGVEIVEDPEA